MENLLKGLIATACIALICVVGYYFWGEYSKYRRGQEIAAGRESARKELFSLAKAKPHEINKVREFCQYVSDKRYKYDDDTEFVRILVRNCNALGYD